MGLSKRAQFLAFLLAGGLISVWRRKDMNWDLQNYHFYNAWAWLDGRMGHDLAPAQLQSYLSPLLDIPFFLLVWSGVPAVVISFLMGLPLGIAVAFFFWIVRYTLAPLAPSERNTVTWLSLLVALTGAASLPVAGSTMNEWHTTALVMPALYMAMRPCCDSTGGRRFEWATVGFLLGAAAGLKLTAAPYPVAVAVASLATMRGGAGPRLATGAALILGGVLGFVVTYGYWAYVLMKEFGNPFFPYFNALFRSPYWFAANWEDVFRPKTLGDAVAFPLQLWEHSKVASNLPQRDPRMPLLLLSLAAIGPLLIARKLQLAATLVPRAFVFLSIFTLTAFIVWLSTFGIYRYIIPIELTGSFLLVTILLIGLRFAPWRRIVLIAVCLVIVAATDRPNWGRRPFGESKSYFGVEVPPLPAGSLVLLYGIEPLGYVLPYLGRNHRYVRPLSNFTHPTHSHQLQREIEQAIAQHRGPIYALRSGHTAPPDEALVLKAYRLQLEEAACLPVQSVAHPGKLSLCPLYRL